MAHISVVIPVYNEERCLHELYGRLTAALTDLTPQHEIVFVDDGSSDDSWRVIHDLVRQDTRVRGLQFSRNFGQHHSITAGLDFCDGDWVVIMDADLQDQPEEIVKLYAKAHEGYHVVLARRGRRKHPLFARVTSWVFSRVFSYLTGLRRDEQVGTFRIMSRLVVENFRTMREQLRYLGGMLQWMGFPTSTVEVQHAARAGGRSGYSIRKRWRLAQDAIVAYSDQPLRLTIRLGFVISALALLFGIYLVFRAIFHGVSVVGWSSVIVSVYFTGGIIIATLGIVGVYLGRSFAEAKRRPLYILRERLNI